LKNNHNDEKNISIPVAESDSDKQNKNSPNRIEYPIKTKPLDLSRKNLRSYTSHIRLHESLRHAPQDSGDYTKPILPNKIAHKRNPTSRLQDQACDSRQPKLAISLRESVHKPAGANLTAAQDQEGVPCELVDPPVVNLEGFVWVDGQAQLNQLVEEPCVEGYCHACEETVDVQVLVSGIGGDVPGGQGEGLQGQDLCLQS